MGSRQELLVQLSALLHQNSRFLLKLKRIKARNGSSPCSSLPCQCCRCSGQHLLHGGSGARPVCAQPRVGSHPLPAVEEKASCQEGIAAAKRQLSSRAGKKGGHCEEAEAEGTAAGSSCSSAESLPELPAGQAADLPAAAAATEGGLPAAPACLSAAAAGVP